MSTSTDIAIDSKVTVNLDEPRMWKVLLMNDDKTPMDFVIDLLKNIFRHDELKAKEITLEVHNTGAGIAGVYSYEIAEHKGVEATAMAKENGFPLQVKLEEE